jgi:hypothetical protein
MVRIVFGDPRIAPQPSDVNRILAEMKLSLR